MNHDHLTICFQEDGKTLFYPEGDGKRITREFKKLLKFFRRNPAALEHIGHGAEKHQPDHGSAHPREGKIQRPDDGPEDSRMIRRFLCGLFFAGGFVCLAIGAIIAAPKEASRLDEALRKIRGALIN